MASHEAIFATGVIGDSPAAWRLDLSGTVQWTFDSRVDIHRGIWATIGLGAVLLVDDGIYLLDPGTGANQYDRGLDCWGQSLSDGFQFVLVNTHHVDGPPVHLGAYDRQGNARWRRYAKGTSFGDVSDDVGATAYHGGIILYAVDYKFGRHSFVAAVDSSTGNERWARETFPLSAISTDGERAYLVETASRGKERYLRARRMADGDIEWSVPVGGTPVGAPVLAEGFVIVDEEEAITAFGAKDGHRAWSTRHPKRPRDPVANATSVAVAGGSSSVILTEGSGLRLLSLGGGSPLAEVGVVDARELVHSPVIVGRRAYVVAGGALVALECRL